MVFPKARLAVSACLFLGWIGFLAYLALRTRAPIILSRPQFLVANLVVLAEVKEQAGRPEGRVTVVQVLWSADDNKALPGDLDLPDLPDCGRGQGWQGAGQYILALTKRRSDFQVTPLPITPGYYPSTKTIELDRIGLERDGAVQQTAAFLGITHGQAANLLGSAPMVLRRNVPLQEAEAFQKRMKEAGALVHLADAETRIYRVSADTLEQWEEIRVQQDKK